MSDDAQLALRPATAQEIADTLSFGLLYEERKRVHHADSILAVIVSERLVQPLLRSGYVLMRRREGAAPSTSRHRHSNAEPQVTTNYSFLRGASHVEELLLAAKAIGMDTLGIVDRNTLARAARAHARATEAGVQLVVGCRLDLRDSMPMLAYPLDRAGYGQRHPRHQSPISSL